MKRKNFTGNVTARRKVALSLLKHQLSKAENEKDKTKVERIRKEISILEARL